MASEALPLISAEEYLEKDRHADTKSQYYRGKMYAMAGGSANHSLIIANAIEALRAAVVGSACRVFDSNLRIHVPATGLYTYPDALTVSGPLEYLDGKQDTILNPTLIIEVLSESTENYDRGSKFFNYRSIPSFCEYLLVAQNRRHIEHWAIVKDHWTLTECTGFGAVVDLISVRSSLPVTEIYRGALDNS